MRWSPPGTSSISTTIQDYVDPAWTSFIPTPPFPGYVSGHSGFSGAAAELLSYAFPRDRTTLRAMSAEAAMSRLYGGIHIRADNDVGLAMGKLIGSVAVARAFRDDVEDLVGRGVLGRSQGNALSASLEAVLSRVNQRNMKGAITELEAFVRQAEAALPRVEAEPLVSAAQEVIGQFAAAH
jgi:hypothetical protein